MYPYRLDNNTPVLIYYLCNKVEGLLVNSRPSLYSWFKLPMKLADPTTPAISRNLSLSLFLYMGSSSINTFSLYSRTHHNPIYLKHRLYGNKLIRTIPFQTSPKPSHFIKAFPQPYFAHIPTSNLQKTIIACSLSPQKNLSNRITEKLVVVLVGSFLFMGCLCARPIIALPAQKTSISENLEEKRETQNGRSEDEDMCVKILEKNPRDVEALKVVLYGKMREGKTKEAVEYVETLIGVEPDEVEWRLLQALCYEMMGQLSKAKRLFKEILQERPLNLRALHGLALVMNKNHEGQAILEMLNKALELARREKRVTEERNIRILIAQMHVVKGELEEGLKKFQDLVDENPRDFRPYLCQGIIYSLLDKKKEAAKQFETYRSLVPEEFPQRGFLDDVVLAAKTKSRERLAKEFEAEFSYRK